MKKKWVKVLAAFLVCIFGIVCVGCGNDSDFAEQLKQKYENGEISREEYLRQRQAAMPAPLYGTKILYRPMDYNWDENVGVGNTNYYGKYAWHLLNSLQAVYGTLADTNVTVDDEKPIAELIQSLTKPSAEANEDLIKSGLYDSLRYQMRSYDQVTLQKILLVEDSEGRLTPSSSPEDTASFLQITADEGAGWNWGLGGEVDYQTDEQEITNAAFLYSTEYFQRNPNPDAFIESDGVGFVDAQGQPVYYPSNEAQHNGQLLTNVFNDSSFDFYSTISNVYNTNYAQDYAKLYLGTVPGEEGGGVADYDNYSDYVKALEYAIYRINLDLQPNDINVSYDAKGMPVVTVVGFAPETDEAGNQKSSATVALEKTKELFEQYGTYVGVTERQQQKLIEWILKNIIGTTSQDTFSITQSQITLKQYVKQVEITNPDGSSGGTKEVMCDINGGHENVYNPVAEITPGSTTTLITIDRSYRDVVSEIVNICTNLVQIGNASGESGQTSPDDPNITDKYPASHVIDFYGSDFFVSGNNEFKAGAEEYQSIVFMFSQKYTFSTVWLAFMYDSDDNPETIDPTKSLDIIVHVNLYTKKYGWRQIGITQNGNRYFDFGMTVQDGPYDHGSKNNTLMLDNLKDYVEGGEYAISCDKFAPDIGNNILASIPDGYSGLISPGTPLPLNGNDARRKYYNLVEKSYDDQDGYSSYGQLNPDMFAGDDGCDYFEITFEIVKKRNDFEKNYKFYTGIILIDGECK